MNDVQDAFRRLANTQASLEETALRIKEQRDEAVQLLRESLLYSATGEHGHFKTRVKSFLARVSK